MKYDTAKKQEAAFWVKDSIDKAINTVIEDSEKIHEFYNERATIEDELYTYDFKETGLHHLVRIIVTVPIRMLEQKETQVEGQDKKVNVYDWHAKGGLFSSHFELLVTQYVEAEEYKDEEKANAFQQRMTNEIKKQLNYIIGNYHTSLSRMENMIKQSKQLLPSVNNPAKE